MMSTNAVINTVFNNPDTRMEMDYYPTPPEVTHALMKFLKEKDILFSSCHEPACGEGDMSKVISEYGVEVFSSDLSDRGFGDVGIDYLTSFSLNTDAIITNPPFKLAEQFIRKALGESQIVGILLKSNYFHAASRLPLFSQNPPAYVLPLTWRPNWFFKTKANSSPTMDVSWYVWLNGISNTKYIPLKKT